MTALDTGRSRAAPRLRTTHSRRGKNTPEKTGSTVEDVGMPALAAAFLVSLVFPIFFSIGGLQLLPYRVILLLAFLPLATKMLAGRAGGLRLYDGLLIASVAWQCFAFLVNHGPSIIPGAGMQVIEVLGAWLLGRVAIRNAADFRRMVTILFVLILVLIPFAVFESVTKRPILLQLLPSTSRPVWPPERFGLRRAQTVFSHPILYGVFVSAAFGLVWYALKPAASFASRALRGMIILFGLFFSLSTGALVSFVVQSAFVGWEMLTRPSPARWRTLAWLVGGGYVLLDILSNRSPFHLLVAYGTFSSGTAYNRILIFRYGMDQIWASPLFGIGRHDWSRPWWMGSSVDNFWLMIAMQFGIPAFLLMTAALFVLIRAVIRSKLDDPTEWACRAGWLTTLGGIIIAGGTVHYWTTMLSFVMFLFAAGSWMIRDAAPTAGGRTAGRSRTPREHPSQPAAQPSAANGPRKPPSASAPIRPARAFRHSTSTARRT